MRVVYSPRYHIDIGLHVFPTRKYRLVYDQLVRTGVVCAADAVEPLPAAWEDLALVHTAEYLDKLRTGAMTRDDVALLELPWSPEMVEGFRLMTGGTILAGRLAVEGRSNNRRHNDSAPVPVGDATTEEDVTRAPAGPDVARDATVASASMDGRSLNGAAAPASIDGRSMTGAAAPASMDGRSMTGAVASASMDGRSMNGAVARPRVNGSVARPSVNGGVARDFSPAILCHHSSPAILCHIGGGLHHAFPNHGEGFCPFNDVAVAVRVLQRDAGVERVAIVDLDVHHGNGTAFIFEADPRVFTFSMHQQHNYPAWKPRGVLDVGLADGTHDATFLSKLGEALSAVLAHEPDCVFYLAGADPFEDDQLGGLRLTKHGLRERDRMVIHAVRDAGLPLVVVLAGGYARNVDDTVDIHCATIEEARAAVIR